MNQAAANAGPHQAEIQPEKPMAFPAVHMRAGIPRLFQLQIWPFKAFEVRSDRLLTRNSRGGQASSMVKPPYRSPLYAAHMGMPLSSVMRNSL